MPRGKKRRARELSSSPSVFSSPDDDDEQGTADLTLHILAKAEKRGQEDRNGTTSNGVAAEAVDSDDAGAAAEEEEEEPVLSAKAKKKKKRKEKEKKEKELKVKKEERKEKRKNKAVAKVANLEDAKAEVDKSAEKELPDAEESLAMRKLLRGPRYFDPPEEQGETCYSCGQQGHRAADCTEQPRQKPCYVCGNFGHEGYDCPEKTECFECGKIGHLARNCPSKVYQPYQARRGTGLCLLCGRLGHDASGCSGEYDPDDFKQVHCYICKRAGHLCCSEVVDSSPFPVSCYQCGDLGHTGLACTRQNEDRGERSSCYRCGQEGHFARECQQTNRDYNIKQRRHSWPAPWSANNGRFGDQESPACQIRPVPFKKRLEQAQTPPAKKKKKSSDEGKKKKGNGEGKKKKNDEGKKGTKRKRNDSDFL